MTSIRLAGHLNELLDSELIRVQIYVMFYAELLTAHCTGTCQDAMPIKEISCRIFL